MPPSCRRWRKTRRRRWRSSGWRRRTDGCGAHQQEQREKVHASSRVLEPGGSNAGGRRLHEGRLADGQLAGAAGEAHPPLRSGWRHGPDRPALGGQALPSLRPAVRHREPRRGERHHRHRGSRQATPDGYTLLLTPNAPLSVQPTLRKTPYDPVKNFTPVGRVGDLISGFVIHPAVGVKTFKEMVDYAKANPGKLAYGSAGLGTASHLRLEMLKVKAGIDILHVPYRGNADALNDILANNVQMMNEINPMPHVKAGKLILLDISYPERHPDFPGVPTLFELGYGEAYVPSWYSIWAPAGTPRGIIDKLNVKMVEIAKTPEMKARLLAINVACPVQTPEEMSRQLVEDTKRNADLIRLTNIKIE
ncbi:MAG: tripartite tricarboxylate transporter substrate binding protein [Alphaproteobacteria bacterium]|nr:MAG: tripartite tricarboxylate transporter substrate binding protein [Alphaproteobacteria bacterium]